MGEKPFEDFRGAVGSLRIGSKLEQVERVRSQRTLRKVRCGASHGKIRAEASAGSVARVRNLLRRFGERKSGPGAGKCVAPMLWRGVDLDRIDEAGERIIDCDGAWDLIA